MKNLMIFSLIFCLSFQLNSQITPEIKTAIRKSYPDKLSLLLKDHNLTMDEKADLLSLSEEVFEINKKQFNEPNADYKNLYNKKKRMRILKFGLSATFGSIMGLGSITCAKEAFTQNMQSKDFLSNICMCPFFALSSAFLFRYAIHSFDRIRSLRSRKQKYLDSKEVYQMVSRLK